jgi:hypothetical protein
MKRIAGLIHRVLRDPTSYSVATAVRSDVRYLTTKFALNGVPLEGPERREDR